MIQFSFVQKILTSSKYANHWHSFMLWTQQKFAILITAQTFNHLLNKMTNKKHKNSSFKFKWNTVLKKRTLMQQFICWNWFSFLFLLMLKCCCVQPWQKDRDVIRCHADAVTTDIPFHLLLLLLSNKITQSTCATLFIFRKQTSIYYFKLRFYVLVYVCLCVCWAPYFIDWNFCLRIAIASYRMVSFSQIDMFELHLHWKKKEDNKMMRSSKAASKITASIVLKLIIHFTYIWINWV